MRDFTVTDAYRHRGYTPENRIHCTDVAPRAGDRLHEPSKKWRARPGHGTVVRTASLRVIGLEAECRALRSLGARSCAPVPADGGR
jgi:hypothetical protein